MVKIIYTKYGKEVRDAPGAIIEKSYPNYKFNKVQLEFIKFMNKKIN